MGWLSPSPRLFPSLLGLQKPTLTAQVLIHKPAMPMKKNVEGIRLKIPFFSPLLMSLQCRGTKAAVPGGSGDTQPSEDVPMVFLELFPALVDSLNTQESRGEPGVSFCSCLAAKGLKDGCHRWAVLRGTRTARICGF